jgi:hypothetical protein
MAAGNQRFGKPALNPILRGFKDFKENLNSPERLQRDFKACP